MSDFLSNEPLTKDLKEIETLSSEQKEILKEKVFSALKQIYDPEIPVNIVDLGLIYTVEISDDSSVFIEMTLTSPGCPVAGTFPQMVQDAVFTVPEITEVKVELVFEPPWTKEKMSEAAKLELNLF